MSLQRELPVERLSSVDERGKRVFLYPADVRGFFHRWRKVVHWVLLVVFLVLPWIQINGHQALLLDIGQRRFSIFGLAFWAHDAPMLLFVFGAAFVGISLITAVWGRLWCGWACPETVFTESVYRQIERWIEGSHIHRKRLAASPWTFKKVALRSAKWLAFLAVTLVITHSFMAYFIGTEALAQMMQQTPAENPSAFGTMAFITAVVLFAFGSFREQFCIIVCPYGRMQSLLIDQSSLVVAYDPNRGEPRRGPEVSKAEQGDCINCYRCVDVCPTGIDIRRGLQMECIACTACVDACDEVMRNTNRPEGLIRYTTENELKYKPNQHFRPRVIILSLALVGILAGLTYVLLTRPPIKATLFHATGAPYEVIQAETATSEALISNRYNLLLSNYTFETGEVEVSVENPAVKIISQANPLQLKGGDEQSVGFFFTFPKSLLEAGRHPIMVTIKTHSLESGWQRVLQQEVPLAGPF